MDKNDLQKSSAKGFEISDANARAIGWGTVACIVFAIFLHWIVITWFTHLKAQSASREKPGPLPAAPTDYRAPADFRALPEAEARKTLQSYHWIDPQKGIVRIPIDQAIKRMSHEK